MMEKSKISTINPPLPLQIGPYKILKKIGQGGMGEVFLGEDPVCKRSVAIKRVRQDLTNHPIIRERFLKEAKITATLFHPSIIPIYYIHQSESELYYVMPYVEGETLKKILKDTVEREEKGLPPHPIGYSIDVLVHIFLNICQGISYAHSLGILHRDLKPENILIGSFDQVLIFDWGLSGYMSESTKDELDIPFKDPIDPSLTRPGKILGTLPYMPPERVEGKPADVHSDIYSLGVIFYQLLTLRMPFKRTTIKEYKKNKEFEKVIDALEIAPERDIPPPLSLIAKKCLAKEQKDRYQSVKEIIADIKRYNAGLPDWIFAADLQINNASDWELQENVLLSKLIPITRSMEIMQWYLLMISKKSFSGNKRIEALITLEAESEGIGFLLATPEPKERECLEEGYCIYIGTKKNPGIKLNRSHVTIFDLPEKYIETEKPYKVAIEKIDQTISLYIDGNLLFQYMDTLPIVGTRIGLISRDMEFKLDSYKVFIGSPNAFVDCLSIPDAFLASRNFDKALIEYEQIASSFSGRIQGREAIFRSGITLIEKAKFSPSESQKKYLLKEALQKFDLLHHTLSSPLEYYGKSLVYRKLQDLDEELKCLELGIRKFAKHPLAHRLEERILFRLHESARNDRIGVYNFALLTIRHIPHALTSRETHSLIYNLLSNREKLYFFKEPRPYQNLYQLYRFMAIQLAFWLDKPLVLKEMYEEEKDPHLKEIVFSALLELGYEKLPLTSLDLFCNKKALSYREYEHCVYLCKKNLTKDSAKDLISPMLELKSKNTFSAIVYEFDQLLVTAYLFIKNIEKAEGILLQYEQESLERPSSPFYFLRGCFLAQKEGWHSAHQHFLRAEDFAFPPLYALLAQFMKDPHSSYQRWVKQAFPYEKKELLRQQVLFYHSLGKKTTASYYERKLNKSKIFSIMG